MTREQLKQQAKEARVGQIFDKLRKAADDGNYEMRVSQMFPEQIEFVKSIGLTYRAIEQKDGTEHEIKWD